MLAANHFSRMPVKLVCCRPLNRQFRKPCKAWALIYKNGHQWRSKEIARRRLAIQSYRLAGKPLPPDLQEAAEKTRI